MIAVDADTIRQDVRQWSGLVLTGAWAALASVALIVIQVVIFLVWPTPRSTPGLCEMLVENPLRGLLALDLLYAVSNLPAYLLYFALAVHRTAGMPRRGRRLPGTSRRRRGMGVSPPHDDQSSQR